MTALDIRTISYSEFARLGSEEIEELKKQQLEILGDSLAKLFQDFAWVVMAGGELRPVERGGSMRSYPKPEQLEAISSVHRKPVFAYARALVIDS